MASFSITALSGSTSGQPVPVSGTATGSANTIHTAGTDDEQVWMWASNLNSTAEVLSIEVGGGGTTDQMKFTIQPNETILVVPGWFATGSIAIQAFTTTTNQVNIVGYVLTLA